MQPLGQAESESQAEEEQEEQEPCFREIRGWRSALATRAGFGSRGGAHGRGSGRVGGSGFGGFGTAAHAADGGGHLGGTKEGGAADEGIGAGPGAFGHGILGDAAIDLDAVGQLFFVAPAVGLLDFGNGFVDERLAAESWIDGHDEHQVHLTEEGADGAHGGGWVNGEAGAEAEGADFPQQTFHAGTEFDVDGELLGAGLGEGFEEDLRSGAHQVDVEELSGEGSEVGDEGGAEGQVGDEMAVHDIEVQPFGAGAGGAKDFAVQPGELRGEEGRGNDHWGEANGRGQGGSTGGVRG